ncbi:ABC transporter permease [Paraburkholderia sp. Ac-20336]|uniref:ABC transporter permease n=1 Tax=Burkholderiaceae TaxID=119060 RepID=UPI001422E055|nr:MULTISPECIES: ABC transporter permease [Burkholderiaceae]MBN3803058.1 ABC transporter permease [Paraburkholderia sp. Ac-20336]MBN3848249.1 ABC transporter permease [Paraburkholderia sp. Ac-20342]NIF53086.1 ABC transporter permease [Burkholderia sp. Ax-1724]NIF80039.1 ABC transporter permease [Paraburkholderia sp. Cy-641]
MNIARIFHGGRTGSVPKLPLIVIVLWILVALAAPWIAPWSQREIIGDPYGVPQHGAILGMDYFGRDMLSRIIFGSRTTIVLAVAANLIASGVGITIGFFSAYAKGWIDEAIGRVMDGLMALPTIMFALVCVSALGSSEMVLVCTVGLIESVRVYRVARAVGLDNLARDYVDLAHLRGESVFWILFREALPNAYPPLLTDFGVRFAATVMLLSAVSFLGLGVQPPAADWGMMVRENLAGLRLGSIAAVFPALAIFSVTFSANKLVDWFLRRSQRDISTEFLA